MLLIQSKKITKKFPCIFKFKMFHVRRWRFLSNFSNSSSDWALCFWMVTLGSVQTSYRSRDWKKSPFQICGVPGSFIRRLIVPINQTLCFREFLELKSTQNLLLIIPLRNIRARLFLWSLSPSMHYGVLVVPKETRKKNQRLTSMGFH